ncbi:MAG: DinB family protein [Betaproteobacteria bacterium]|nr:DinB family protein [Betaproteobacteria bacterium]
MPTWKQHFIEQADYQHWADDILFTAIDHLTPEAIEGDAGLFFKSIHHTVDHILMVSRVWFARLRGEALNVDWRVIHHPDWRELKMALRREVRQHQAWLEAQPEDWFEGEAEFTASDGKPRRMSVHDALTHVFGHYQHHRGQVSAACTRLGAPCPEMDFVYYRRAVEKLLNEVGNA